MMLQLSVKKKIFFFETFVKRERRKNKFVSQMELITKSKERCFSQSTRGAGDYGREKRVKTCESDDDDKMKNMFG
jgi:hypothetical protein